MSQIEKNRKFRFSNKFTSIHNLNVLVELLKKENVDNDYQILLLTPYGFIKGDLEEISDKDSFVTIASEQENNPYSTTLTIDLSYLVKLRAESLKKLQEEKDVEIIDNGGTLNFRNVEIYKDNLIEPIAKLSQMLVFVDQIISFSLIPR